MPLSWNEIKTRAVKFSTDWADAANEDAEAKPFLADFFKVFGIESRKFGYFEHRVKKLDDSDGYIDLFWKQHILVEMKTRGKDLKKAYKQAKEYLDGIKQEELPRLILVSDFENFNLYDLEDESNNTSFLLKDLVKNVDRFGLIAGYQKKIFKEQDPVNIKAAELLGKFHDSLKNIGYEGHPLEIYLVRILFCLFAEDTAIFNKQQFQDFIEQRTNEDGSDLASKLQELFQVLNTSEDKRYKTLDEQIAEFPYVNGRLFEEVLPIASFDSKMRKALLDCCYLDWSMISPAIFGAMFQSVMNPEERRNLGAHYTSEKNIMKLIKPLFLDELWKEFESIKSNDNKLKAFHEKISKLKFFDPACGCGNFLVITYRELRLLELEILRTLNKHGQNFLNIDDIVLLNVDMMYGVEIEEFPAQIAQVAMWLIDHQMNLLISNEFGQYYARLPLKKSANIVNDNSLRIEWGSIVPKDKLSYIMGNPPFGGKHLQTKDQKADISCLMQDLKNCSDLDYVTGWFYKASDFIYNTNIEAAFVSTNSIVQGEQVSILWNALINQFCIKINFAHRTFKWNNEAKGNAAVHCVIIGFAFYEKQTKVLFEYETPISEPHEFKVDRINPYLNSGSLVVIGKRQLQICNAPEIIYGNKPVDNGQFLFTEQEKNDFIKNEPQSEKYFKKFIGADEFIKNKPRWCLWLKDADPTQLKSMPNVVRRIEEVRKFRLNSTALPTKKSANTPSLFFYISQPSTNYLVIPEISSERRIYIPIGYESSETISSNRLYLIPNANLFTFGILCSLMHMVWTKTVCGRLESRYCYSGSIVYNNFPWPESPSEKQKETIGKAAQKVLDARAQFPESSLADLYDPLTMPPVLVKAHQELDKMVDLAYRSQPFPNETKRIEFLFELYEKYTGSTLSGLEDEVKQKKKRRK